MRASTTIAAWTRTKVPVRFGSNIADYANALGLHMKSVEHDGEDEWREYESSTEEVRVSTCNGIVTGIACDREFIHRDRNLIGLTEDEARSTIGSDKTIESDAGLGHFVEFGSLGIELLISDGLVEIVSVTIDPDSVL